MAELRGRESHRFVKQDLPGRIVEVVVAADDVCDAHQGIVDDHAEIVRGRPVRALDDEVVHFGVRETHLALDQVPDDGRAFRFGEEADAKGLLLVLVRVSAEAVVFRLLAGRQHGFFAGVDFLGGAEALVGLAFVQELFDVTLIEIHAVHLMERPFVPIQTEPFHPLHDRVDVFVGGAFAVRVFDPQDEGSAGLPGVKPVEKGGTGPSDVKMTGR